MDTLTAPNMTYTCPMHPQIQQPKPGACPICGMALEASAPAKEEIPNVELQQMQLRFWGCLLLVLPVLFLTMGRHVPGLQSYAEAISPMTSAWLQAILTTVIVLWGGWVFFQRGWASLVNRNLNMFTLIALGIAIAFVYSWILLLFPMLFPETVRGIHTLNLYFESAAVITVLVLLGQLLELRGRDQTGAAIRALLSLVPATALKVNADGSENLISVDQLKVEDKIRIKPGERIPLDGQIVSGNSTVDESMLSGEAIPVEKSLNSTVIGGTFNLTGTFIMQVSRIGKETLLSQIIEQVSTAQRSKAPIQKLADTIAAYFVPMVLIISLLSFLIWTALGPEPAIMYGLTAAIAVLIIACPCALGLATPMSIMVGMGQGAKIGILIKDADSIERFEKINTLVVDKTGTLTIGKPSIKQIVTDQDETSLLQMAASLANQSEHPLSNAIMAAARERQLSLFPVTDFHYSVGKGIQGKVENKFIALGNLALVNALGVKHEDWETKATELANQGDTVTYVMIDNKITGLIAIADTVKPSAKAAIASLQKAGIKIVMLTGDSVLTAKAISQQLGIGTFKAEVLPQDKYAVIEALKKNNHQVAMAGDGINDAPALAAADVGIAMGNGTDIAIKSANITLVKGDLMGIVRARQLSKKVMWNIRENLFLAFIYNIVCIPIAAGILYPWLGLLLSPMIAAAAMSLSSISVIANALRLRV